MTEELLDEAAYRRLTDTAQESLIAGHCGDIEHRILSAPNADDARAVSEEACRMFREECASNLVGKALTDHVMGLYEKHWGMKTGGKS